MFSNSLRLLGLLVFGLFCSLATPASAANCGAAATNCFWVGGTGTWDTNPNAHWANTSAGTGGCGVGTCGPPASGVEVTFDGSSGGGTVTVATDINIKFFECGNFTGTLTWTTNNVTITGDGNGFFDCNASATKTINAGTGLWTITDTTQGMSGTVIFNVGHGLTLNASSTPFHFTNTTGGQGIINDDNQSYTLGATTLSYTGSTSGGFSFQNGAGMAFGAVTISSSTAPMVMNSNSSNNITASSITITMPAGKPLMMYDINNNGQTWGWSVSAGTVTCALCSITNVTATGGATFTATGLNGGNTSGWTITTPGGSPGIIGG